jgi:hypothetical protein
MQQLKQRLLPQHLRLMMHSMQMLQLPWHYFQQMLQM